LVGLTLTLQRALALEFLRYWRRRGKNFRNIIIAGTGHQAIEVAEHVLRRPELGIRVRGFVDLREEHKRTPDEVHHYRERFRHKTGRRLGRFLEGTESLQKALKNYAIDEIIFTDIIAVMSQVEESVLICAEQGARTTIAADLFSVGMVKSEMSFFGGMPLIHFETPPGDRWELSLKRVFDFAVAFLALVVLSPFLLLIALIVKSTSPGPVLFVQKRVGQNGRLFNLYKFRSMVQDAESQLADLQEYNEMSGPVFKMDSDPRVTPFGKFLRRFSLDELPQLWNVLLGDMSLVGPRPPVPGEVGLYKPKDRRRLSMRPGLTCTWQVSGRNEISDFESWVQMDLDYIDNWSLTRDMSLLLRTIPAVIFGTGAR
ncbi:MAG: sugar transferase, partial [Bdellovibrionales bacterium]|nr:sugar transferase [Bdellovibrionales bacterium]